MNGWTLWLTQKLWPITELTSEHLLHWLKDDLMSKSWYQGISVIWGDGIAESTCPSTAWPLLGLSCSDIKYASLWSPSRGCSIAAGVRTWSHCTGNWGSAVAGGAFFLIAPASGSACCSLDLDLGFSDIRRCYLTLASPCLLSVDFCPAVLVLLHLCVHGFWVSLEHRGVSVSTLTNKALVGRLLHWPRTVLSYKYGVGAGTVRAVWDREWEIAGW